MTLPLFDIPMQRTDVLEDAAVLGRKGNHSGANTDGQTGNRRSQEPSGARPDTRTRTKEVKANDGQKADARPPHLQARPSDVERVFIHRYGYLLHLQAEGKPPREYRVVMLHDGRLFDEFIDNGERSASRFSMNEITRAVEEGKFREVAG